MPNGWRTINSLVHKIRLHGRRGKGKAESFSRQKSRHAPQKEGGLKILCDLPPVWPRLVRPTNLMSRMDGKKTHTHIVRDVYLSSNNHLYVQLSVLFMFLFRCVSHPLPLPLFSCLGCIPPLIGLPFLRGLLRSILCGCLLYVCFYCCCLWFCLCFLFSCLSRRYPLLATL